MAQGLRLHTSTAKVWDAIPDWGTKSQKRAGRGQKKKTLKQKSIKEAIGKSKNNPFLRARRKLNLSPGSTNFVFLAGLGVVCRLSFELFRVSFFACAK